MTAMGRLRTFRRWAKLVPVGNFKDHYTMITKVFEKRVKPGEDECLWWAQLEAVAADRRCAVVSYRGPMWKRSKGRDIVYGVTSSSEYDLGGFALARPT